jgi:hypothetical protein
MSSCVEIGSMAPELSLRADEDLQAARHRTRVLAFVHTWSIDQEPLELAHVRGRLEALDAELVIVCDEGAWSFTGDESPIFCDRLAADVATTAAVYGVRGDAVFVIDPRGVVRFAHAPDRSLSATITEALDAAGEAMAWREHHTPLERVQWSQREWALKSLVVGCSLTFEAVPRPRRLARGTGAIRAVSRAVGADADAPVPTLVRLPAISE